MPHTGLAHSGPVISTTVQTSVARLRVRQRKGVCLHRPRRIRTPINEVRNGGEKAQEEEQKRHHRRRKVIEENAKNLALLLVYWNHEHGHAKSICKKREG